jgi:hypothetical protein
MIDPADLDVARQDLAAELLDRITVERWAGQTLDDTTLDLVDIYTPTATGVAALVVPDTGQPRQVDETGNPIIVRAYRVTIADLALDVRKGDRVVVTASHDPRTVGAVLTVRDPRHGSVSISRRLICQELPRTGEQE